MRNKFFWVGLLLLAAVLHNCRKNDDTTTVTELGHIPTVNVESALIGRVVDTNGQPVANAQVKVAGETFSTNSTGRFFVSQRLLDKNGTYVHVQKSGFFDGAKFAFPGLGGTAQIEIQLVPRYELTNFSAASGGAISLNTGVEVNIPANAVSTTDGQAYSGNVHVYGIYLYPTDPTNLNWMPGDLRASDANQQPKVLKSFGMIGVELEGDAGQALNLASGQKAAIKMQVPSSLLSAAPSSLPLWHFDYADGYWKEEGTAALNGQAYEGEVSHFSFWNCDVALDYALINGRFVGSSNEPLAGVRVTLTSQNFGSGQGFTDTDGHFGGIVPTNETFQMNAISACNNQVYNAQVGPFAPNQTADLGDLVGSSGSNFTVQGSVVDCSNLPLANAQVIVTSTTGDTLTMVLSDNNGNFATVLTNCAAFSELQLTVVDNNSPNYSGALTFPISSNEVNAGTISVCTPLDQYILINVDGQSHCCAGTPGMSVIGGVSWLSAKMPLTPTVIIDTTSAINWNYASIAFDPPSGNVAVLKSLGFWLSPTDSYGCSYCPSCPCSSTETVQLTSFASQAGQYSEGTVSGTTNDPSGNSIPFTATFRVKR